MQRLTRTEFESRFARRSPVDVFSGLSHGDLHVARDATLSGLIEGSLFIHEGAHVLVTGVVEGSAYVKREAVLWVEGVIEGTVHLDGAALVNGATGGVRGHDRAVLHDPCEPADSDVEPAVIER